MTLDTESPALTPAEQQIARQLAAKVARARVNADKTATQLYSLLAHPNALAAQHHKLSRGDL